MTRILAGVVVALLACNGLGAGPLADGLAMQDQAPDLVPRIITFPGVMIALLTLGFSMLGEGLNEILNPRLTEN